MKVEYFAASYKRPERSPTQVLYPFVSLVVRESEVDEYERNGNRVIPVPDSAQGNVARVKNYILDHLWKDDVDCVVLMDDDCRGIFRWVKQKKKRFTPEELMEFGESSAILCEDYGFKLWGVNCVPDKGAYREHTPFATQLFCGSPLHGHLRNGIRYDERLPLKEDYDITLQHIREFGGAFRVNYAFYDVKQAEQVGGCATYRNTEREREQFEALRRKWGSRVITRDPGSRRSFDFNPILKSPRKGV